MTIFSILSFISLILQEGSHSETPNNFQSNFTRLLGQNYSLNLTKLRQI